MSFTDQKPRIATVEDTKALWGGGKDGRYFRCKLCGHQLVVGDYWRWIFIKRYTNIIVCRKCDTPDVEEQWIKINKEWEHMKKASPFWWFIDQLEEAAKEVGSLGNYLNNRGK